MKVVVVGPNLRDQSRGQFHVHVEGCGDLRRDPVVAREDQSFVVDAASRTDVVDAVYDPGEFDCESGEYVGEFYFAPCVELDRTNGPRASETILDEYVGEPGGED